jgi:hypothetical protein
MRMQQRLPLIVLSVGLLLITIIAVTSFFPLLTAAQAVKDIEQTEHTVEQYLHDFNDDLQIDEIMEFTNHFYVIVQEQSTGVHAFELLVDRYTGRIGPEPGPNMMWNQKYGHMGMMNNPTTTMPRSLEEATQAAQNWLDTNFLGAMVEEGKTFYGYYTMDISREGHIFGMLSVNGYTGDVWYHHWHGEFLGMDEHD